MKNLFKTLSKIRTRIFSTAKNKSTFTGELEVERMGFRWRLDTNTYIGRTIAEQGIFEPLTTNLILDLIRPGMYALDVGANIGYFTLLLARNIGADGQVWAFEPVEKYRDSLIWHLKTNGLLANVEIVNFGLSDMATTSMISIGDSSATLHWCEDFEPYSRENIELRTLDDCIDDLGIKRIDLIKLDIDGHEPHFIQGARKTIQKFRPAIILEFSQINLHAAGTDVIEQANSLKEFDYEFFSQKTREHYKTEEQFLKDCGKLEQSCNVLAVNKSRMDEFEL